MKSYLDIVQKVLDKGKLKGNRTGVRTLVVPNIHFSHDMADGFPLLTTKKMAVKSIAVELEGFIGGVTKKSWYQERNCKIWDEWNNPKSNDKNDLGPIYGYQWRNFNLPYYFEVEKVKDYTSNPEGMYTYHFPTDQLVQIVEKLHHNPDDRRMVCSAWNPQQISEMALPPCHLMFVITHLDGVLNLHWTQRSCDLMLGVPFNIASYALLLELLCKEANMTPGNLSGMLCDCHIYENHIDGAKEQLTREPKPLPTLELLNWQNIWSWTHEDMKVHNYSPAPKISMEVAV
jgi:thymidylate synthase